MSSETRSTRLPGTLAAAMELRAKALGYASWNAYIKGLARYDLLVQGEHSKTLPWSTLSLSEQEEIDTHLLKLTTLGKGERGQLLKHILKLIQDEGISSQEALKKAVE